MKEMMLCTQREIRSTAWLPLPAKDLKHIRRGSWLRRQIERLAVWTLVRLGAQFDRPIEQTSYHRTVIDSDSLLQRMNLCQRDMDLIWRREAKYIVMGYKTTEELLGELESRYFNTFNIHPAMACGGSLMQYRGMTVVTVPWLEEGVLLLPELGERR